MEKIIYFDYCALIIIFLVLVSIFFRKMIHGRVNRYFLITVATTFLTIFFDIWAISQDNLAMPNETLSYFVHSGYLFFHSLTIPVYITYLVALTDTWHVIRKHALNAIALPLPAIIITVLLIINVFNHKTFYLDETYSYTRGDWFPLVYVSGILYAVYGVSYICYYKKLFKPSRFWAFMSVFALVSLATVFQMFYPAYPVEMFATSVGLLYIAMLVQRPEENVDIITGLHNLTVYGSDMKKGLSNGKHVHIILINITNFASIRDMLGYDTTNDLLRLLADKLTELSKKNKFHTDLYYLDKGRFRFVMDLDLLWIHIMQII